MDFRVIDVTTTGEADFINKSKFSLCILFGSQMLHHSSHVWMQVSSVRLLVLCVHFTNTKSDTGEALTLSWSVMMECNGITEWKYGMK